VSAAITNEIPVARRAIDVIIEDLPDRTFDVKSNRRLQLMKVFVAGASGAIGRPLVAALVAARHEVIGMTSRAAGMKVLREKGAEGVVVNALDAEAVRAEIARIQPDAIIDELTSLPKRYAPEEMRAAAPRDRRIRLEGGGNLYRAATETSVRRYIVQSTGFFYGRGKGLALEEDPLAHDASPSVAGSVATYTQIENRVFSSPGLVGIALRYGFFYGPGTYHDPEHGSISEQVRQRQYPVIDPATGVFSFIHVEDAAAATVAALEIPSGVYNIVDDDPVALAVWLPAFAGFVGAPPPFHISDEAAIKTGGPDLVYYATQLRGASNEKAKKEFGFAPRRLEWLRDTGRRSCA
jgi:nucleoside-diphosphate-sugar epimerase